MDKRWKVGVVVALSVGVGFCAYYFMRQRTFDTLLTRVREQQTTLAQQDLVAINQDTYGSSTPEGTLDLYKQAILQGNYELATEFFILEKHDKEFIKFLSADWYTREAYLQVLEKLEPGTYSDDGALYTMRAPLDGPDFFARFRKYPNNLWKIIEI